MDGKAKIRAITGSEKLTTGVIGKLIKTDKIDLPLKKDNLDFDIETSLTEYFKSDTLSGEGFNMLPAVEGVGAMSKTYPHSSFENRRITIVNATISLIVQIVYQSSYFRVIDEYNGKISFAQQEKYSIDAWTKKKSEQKLFMYFKEQLAKKFVDMEIVKETRRMNVAVLYADKQSASALQWCDSPAADNPGTTNSLTYEAGCSTIGDLVEYLESYGKCGMPVIDETGLAGKYMVSFQLEPGKKSALEESLQSLGLYLKNEVREITVVVIRRKTSFL